MPLDLLNLEAPEAERIAYAEGFTMAAELFARIAELFARIAELEAERDQLVRDMESVQDDAVALSLERCEDENGPAEEYKEFFFECFARLAGHYPAPDISNYYDKGVIFAAIEKGEEAEANEGRD